MYVCMFHFWNLRLFECKTVAMNSNEILKFCCMHVQHIVFAAVPKLHAFIFGMSTERVRIQSPCNLMYVNDFA